MKVTNISMKEVKNGKPFETAQWRKPTAAEKAKVYNALSQINESRINA